MTVTLACGGSSHRYAGHAVAPPVPGADGSVSPQGAVRRSTLGSRHAHAVLRLASVTVPLRRAAAAALRRAAMPADA